MEMDSLDGLVTVTAVPTTAAGAENGYALAGLYLFVFFAGAFLMVGAGVVVAGWAAVRGSVFRIPLDRWQRRTFAVAAGCFLLAALVFSIEYDATTGVLILALLAVGGVALLAGLVWVAGAVLRGTAGG